MRHISAKDQHCFVSELFSLLTKNLYWITQYNVSSLYTIGYIWDMSKYCGCISVWNANVFQWFTVFWADEIDTDLLSFQGLRHFNLLRPANALQQHQVPGKQTRCCLLKINMPVILKPDSVFFYIMVNGLCSDLVTLHNIGGVFYSSREFLYEDHSVVRVSNDKGDKVVVGRCSPGQQLCLVFQVHLHHNLRYSAAVPRKLKHTNKT